MLSNGPNCFCFKRLLTLQRCQAHGDMAEVVAVNAGRSLPPIMNGTFPIEEDVSVAPAAPPVPQISEDYLFVEARHPNTVLQGLNSLRLNNAFCDVTLCCGGQEFPCHRLVLASFSSYFQVNLQKLAHWARFMSWGIMGVVLPRPCFPLI